MRPISYCFYFPVIVLAHLSVFTPTKTLQAKPLMQLTQILITSAEQWEACLISSDPEIQIKVIQLSENAARAQGLQARHLSWRNLARLSLLSFTQFWAK